MERVLTDINKLELELYFSCRGLADLDTVTVTDSFLVVYLSDRDTPPIKIHETKTHWNDLNPDYDETATITYKFDVEQMLTMDVYHKEMPPRMVGRATASLTELYNLRENGLNKQLVNQAGKPSGHILVRARVLPPGHVNQITFDLKLRALPAGPCPLLCSMFSPSNPFIRIRKTSSKDSLLIYESEPSQESRNPDFRGISMTESKMCDGNYAMPLLCEVFEYSDRGNHTLIASFQFTLAELPQCNRFRLMKNGLPISSEAFLENISNKPIFTWDMFTSKGMELFLDVCVDFTASNLPANDPKSLHYIGSGGHTLYEQAMNAVMDVLVKTTHNKLNGNIGLYGFGAKVRMPNLNTDRFDHHCFPLNDNASSPFVGGQKSMLATYRNAIRYLEFGNITLFAPFLTVAMEKAKRNAREAPNRYLVLLVLTDGGMQDFVETCDILIKCGRLPLSVIMVGIGNNDFSFLHRLDDNDMLMTNGSGQRTERDLVTFVNFAKCNYSAGLLAYEVMKELPRQIVDYCRLVGLSPEDMHVQTRFPERPPSPSRIGGTMLMSTRSHLV